jgi:glycine betaine/proline transport system ATP-binding protein
MGMVFQNFGLLPHLTTLDNVAFPLRVQGIPLRQRRDKARDLVRLVGLQGKEGSLPSALSGGQQQRVGIARSLAVDPALWFLDEPFSALDPLIRREMQDEFLRLQKMLNKTIVFITHDIHEAFRLADRIAIMRDGNVIQIGTPAEIILKPADDYVANFMEDVPLSQVLTVRDVMQQAVSVDSDAGACAVPAGTRLAAVLPNVLSGTTRFKVIGPDERSLGHLSSATIAEVLKRDLARRAGS